MRPPTIVATALFQFAAACGRGSSAPAPSMSEAGQHAGFVVTRGADTVHLEEFRATPGGVEGTIVTRTPALRIGRWTLTREGAGNTRGYTIETRDAAGTVVAPTGSMTYAGDTIIRTTLRNGQLETQRVPSSVAALPSPGLPYVGVSYLMYETALNDARRRRDTAITQLGMPAAQLTPARTRALFHSRHGRDQLLRCREEWLQVRRRGSPRSCRLARHDVRVCHQASTERRRDHRHS